MWYFLDTGKNPAAWNMAMDDVLADAVARDPRTVFIRIYQWDPWAVTIGYAQEAEKNISLEKLTKKGYHFVRRATGGRAVFHANEITYSVIASIQNKDLGKSLHETYKIISQALLQTFLQAGFKDLQLKRSSLSEELSPRGAVKPCFSSAARYEILFHNKKLIGSAQRRMKGAILQHGAIPLDSSFLGLTELMNIPEKEKGSMKKELKEKACSLSDVAGSPVDYQSVASVFKTGFECITGNPVAVYTLTEQIKKKAELLVEEKYGTKTWNLRI